MVLDCSHGLAGGSVDVLIQKGKFAPPIAVAIAEAIDMSIVGAQLVTVPVFEAKMYTLEARIDSKIDAARAEIVRWVFMVRLGNVALSTGAVALLNYLQR